MCWYVFYVGGLDCGSAVEFLIVNMNLGRPATGTRIMEHSNYVRVLRDPQ